jgi:hypothetical protein
MALLFAPHWSYTVNRDASLNITQNLLSRGREGEKRRKDLGKSEKREKEKKKKKKKKKMKWKGGDEVRYGSEPGRRYKQPAAQILGFGRNRHG